MTIINNRFLTAITKMIREGQPLNEDQETILITLAWSKDADVQRIARVLLRVRGAK